MGLQQSEQSSSSILTKFFGLFDGFSKYSCFRDETDFFFLKLSNKPELWQKDGGKTLPFKTTY